MKKFIPFLIVVFLLFNYSFNLKAQTVYLQDTLVQNQIISADTLKITGDLYISNGVTLSLSAGLIVEFQGYYKIDVQGCLKAEGAMGANIFFTIADTSNFSDTSTLNGGWAGIFFIQTPVSNDSSIFSYCKFAYGKKIGNSNEENSGGAVYIDNFSKIRFSNSSFFKNFALMKGGAIYCGNHSSPIIEHCKIFDNRTYSEGGGIYIGPNSNVKIYNNIIFQNAAVDYYFKKSNPKLSGAGGGIYSSSPSLNNYNPKIYGNKIFNNESFNGGGIYESNYQITIINNLVCNNEGGGIMNGHSLGQGKYFNNTLCNNSIGGGVQTCSSHLSITDCILWGNTTFWTLDSNPQVYVIYGNPPKLTYCNVQNGYPGIGNMDTLPQFISPTAGDGLSFSALNADWALNNISPCVNSGVLDTSYMSLPSFDVLGYPRIVGNRIDMGAIENQIMNGYGPKPAPSTLRVFPNPTDDYIFVELSQNKPFNYELFDAQGKLVLSGNSSGNSLQINLHKFKSGIYFYRVFDAQNQIYQGKITKR